MVRRQGTMAGGEGGALLVGQLLGMQLDRQPQRPRLGKERRKVLGRKGDGFAEGIDRIDQPLGMGGAQRGQGDLCDVSLCAAFVFRREWHGRQGALSAP